MLLAIDIGNTNIVVGAFDGEQLIADWRLETVVDRTSDEYAVLLQGLLPLKGITSAQIQGVCISSVVPRLIPTFLELSAKHFDAPSQVVNAARNTGVRLRAEHPEEVGADRIVNALAAARRHRLPSIIVDFGTATTFDAVSAEQELLGSAIAPGFHTSLEGLIRRAARLFAVELTPPPHAIGRNTADSVRSGAVLGYIGLVEGLIARFRAEMEGDPLIIATGGLASMIAPHTDIFDVVDADLTLHGLRLYYELNQS